MKYTKKINKHYEYITKKDYLEKSANNLRDLKNASALLEGGCFHLLTGDKQSDKIKLIKNSMPHFFEGICGDEDKVINVYGELLSALCAYSKVTGEKDLSSQIGIANFLVSSLYEKIEEIISSNEQNFALCLSAVNGVSEYYAITKEQRAKELLNYACEKINKLNVYNTTSDCFDYLNLCLGLLKYAFLEDKSAVNNAIALLYDHFMVNAQSLNYASATTFKNKSETNGASTAKSLEVALALLNNTKDNRYLTLARRIWFNGMQFCQRENGQVGLDTFTDEKITLRVKTYEVTQFVTPAYACGLKCWATNKNLFEESGELYKDRRGRFFLGDKMFARDLSGFFGRDLIEIPTLTAFDKQTANQLEFKLVF